MAEPERKPITGALRRWAASGAMALTGRPDGSPLGAPGDPVGTVETALARIATASSALTGVNPELPGIGILSERAAIAGLSRNGPWSCGGSFRTLPTVDGWWGLSLPRREDMEMVAALVSAHVSDPWDAVADWSANTTTDDAVGRGRLLGLACAAVPTADDIRPGVVVTYRGGSLPRHRARPRVVDLTALWAGPLCAHLLGLLGAEVIKVEGIDRPDGARRGPQAFFDLLHADHAMVALDLHSANGLRDLNRLLDTADVVLESSRPRALAHLGVHADHYVNRGVVWTSITARGRNSNTIGFGDDVAAGAGLVAMTANGPLPCGDAIADPLAGVIAAAATVEALVEGSAALLDVSMHHVCAEAGGAPLQAYSVSADAGTWWVSSDDGRYPVREPVARRSRGPASPLGADNHRILGGLP